MTLSLVDEAVASGARISQACAYLQVTPRTLQRWREQGPDGGDDRRRGPHKTPPNALSAAERKDMLVVIAPDAAALPGVPAAEIFLWPRDEDRLKLAFLTGA